jgi:hypothetical protein
MRAMIGDLIRAAIRMCDAATRAFEVMAESHELACAQFQAGREANLACMRSHEAACAGHEAYVKAEKARESAWIVGSVSGSVVEFHGAGEGEK